LASLCALTKPVRSRGPARKARAVAPLDGVLCDLRLVAPRALGAGELLLAYPDHGRHLPLQSPGQPATCDEMEGSSAWSAACARRRRLRRREADLLWWKVTSDADDAGQAHHRGDITRVDSRYTSRAYEPMEYKTMRYVAWLLDELASSRHGDDARRNRRLDWPNESGGERPRFLRPHHQPSNERPAPVFI